MIVIYVVVFGASFYFCTLILNKYWNKIITKLDMVNESPAEFENIIRKKKHFANYAVTGFRFAHPLVID